MRLTSSGTECRRDRSIPIRGRSAPDHWLAQFTDQLIDLMDHMGIEKAVIEGESLGGWIAFDMAINHPHRTSKVILNTAWGMHLEPGSCL